MRLLFISLIVSILLCACSTHDKYACLQESLTELVDGRDNIGIAIIIDGKDTVTVNGNREFPMLSVYKFPIALALGEHYRQNNLSLDFPIAIFPEDLHTDTYSPMTEKIISSDIMATDTLKIPTKQLLSYMLQQSDNNASDIVLKQLGGPGYVDSFLRAIGIIDVNVLNSENEMHQDNRLCYANSATPIAMACLIDRFDREFDDSISHEIKQIMETCVTGVDRLAKPMIHTNAVIGHKTGTGFTLPDGRLIAVNDAGYVHLPGGHRYAIAVFIENSGYSMAQTESIIAEISRIVFSALTNTFDIGLDMRETAVM